MNLCSCPTTFVNRRPNQGRIVKRFPLMYRHSSAHARAHVETGTNFCLDSARRAAMHQSQRRDARLVRIRLKSIR